MPLSDKDFAMLGRLQKFLERCAPHFCRAKWAQCLAVLLLIAACNERGADTSEAREELARSTFYFLFGIDETKTNNLWRSTVFRFASDTIYLVEAEGHHTEDYSQHAHAVTDILGLFGLKVKHCNASPKDCGANEQIFTLTLRDDSKKSASEAAELLAIEETKFRVDLSKGHAGPVEVIRPAASKDADCAGLFSSGPSADAAATGPLRFSLINIKSREPERLACTIAMTLFAVGLVRTPEMVQSSNSIAELLLAGKAVSQLDLPRKALPALDLLYSEHVDGPLTEARAWDLIRNAR